jgi:LysR family transcriptional regulator, regulator for metE and metH
MIRLEVRDLRLVSAIAEMGNLTRAGHHLHLTQSALSHQLADLEQRIGGKLFERSGRRLIATRLGELLCGRAKITLAQLREVETDLVEMANGREATLRIATECYTCYHWLPPVLDAFRARHPAIDVRIVPGATTNPIRALISGSIDLSIVSSRVRDRRVRATPLFDDELVLVVGARHPLATRRAVDVAELRNERFLMYSGPDDSRTFRDILAPAGVSPSQLSTLQLTEAIIELVKADMGVSVLARWAVTPYLESGALRAVSIDHPAVRRTWQAVMRANQSPPEYVTDFVGFLSSSIATPPRGRPEFSLIRSVSKLSAKRRAASSGA